MKIVPDEPTVEMENAAGQEYFKGTGARPLYRAIKAAIAAAPSQEALRSEWIEQCAKVCESFSDGHTACRNAADGLQVHRIPLGHDATNCPHHIAAAIRSLAK